MSPGRQTCLLSDTFVEGRETLVWEKGKGQRVEVEGKGVEAACNWRWRLAGHVVDPLQRCVHSLI